jgi:hypothetical protein
MLRDGTFSIGTGDDIVLVNGIQHCNYNIGLMLEESYKLIGLPADRTPTGEEAKTISDNISEWYSDLTHAEILLAFQLAVHEVFEVDTEHYQKVSVKYISRILKAYKKWKEPHLRALEEKVISYNRDYLLEYLESVTKEQTATKELIVRNYEMYLEENCRNDKRCFLRSKNYEDLKLMGLMGIPNEGREELIEGFKKQARAYIAEKANDNTLASALKNAISPSKAEDEAKIFAIYYKFECWKNSGITGEKLMLTLNGCKDIVPLDYDENIQKFKRHNENRGAL